MKKMSISGSILLASLILVNTGASAQKSLPFKIGIAELNNESAAATSSSSSEKVMKAFNSMYQDATKIHWTSERKLERVYFERDGKATRAVFTKSGKFLHSVTTYTEEYLPKDVLLAIKNAYYGKKIFGVTEVSAMGKSAYLVTLQDKTSWLYIKVLDNEVTEEKVMLRADH